MNCHHNQLRSLLSIPGLAVFFGARLGFLVGDRFVLFEGVFRFERVGPRDREDELRFDVRLGARDFREGAMTVGSEERGRFP